MCIRLDIASPQQFDRLLFAFVFRFFTEKKILMSPRPPRARLTHRAHRSAARYMLNCKQQKGVRVVAEWRRAGLSLMSDSDRSDPSSNLMQADKLFLTLLLFAIKKAKPCAHGRLRRAAPTHEANCWAVFCYEPCPQTSGSSLRCQLSTRHVTAER